MTNCQVEESLTNPELSNNREELFFKDVPNNKLTSKEGSSIETFLENENKETQFLQTISDQKGLPIWGNLKTFKNKSLTNKNSESSITIIPLTDNDKNLSSLLFVDSKSNGKTTIYSITNDELFEIVDNQEIPKEIRETILMQFLYFDYLSFGRRLYTNIPVDLFSNIKVKKNSDYKEFKISVSNKTTSVTSRQISDVCISFNSCNGKCRGTCDECSSCQSTRCYGFGGSTAPGNFGSSEGGNGGSGSTGGGSSGGGNSNSSTPWYLMNPDIDIYRYPTKVRNVFKNLTDYDVVLQREQLDYLKNNTAILDDITLLLVNNSQEKSDFTNNVISALNDGAITSYKQFTITVENFKYSLKSPCNVDLSSILENQTLPENQKFNEVYNALTTSPMFQKLFLSIFENNTRFNVKFQINEHVYKDGKEVNATTEQDPVTKNITIKISKQILTAGTDTTKRQTKIENAKTILHECIHAFLFVKANNSNIGIDIAKAINETYPNKDEQHNFMANKMIPTMQKVLGEIRDSVTKQANRDYFVNFTLHPTTAPLTSVVWDWVDYYKYLSLNGLQETNYFKVDFPVDSFKYNVFTVYNSEGHKYLNK